MSTGTRTRQPARKTGRRPAGSTRGRRSGALHGLGRAVAAMWRGVAALLGGMARAAGRNAATARDLPAEHRRDGAALGVLTFGAIAVMSVWFHAAGPIGRGIDTGLRAVMGNGALLVPLALLAGGAHMLRQVPEPGARGRVLVGAVAIILAVLGLLDVWSGSPTAAGTRAHAGGLLGYAVGAPLSKGLSAALAVPLPRRGGDLRHPGDHRHAAARAGRVRRRSRRPGPDEGRRDQ